MQRAPIVVLSLALLILQTRSAPAEDYLTKDGKLTQQLKVTQLQGGFAGNTGRTFTIAPDGSWTKGRITIAAAAPQKKGAPEKASQEKGKLTEKELTEIGAILKKYDLANLPVRTGKAAAANPHTVTIQFGKQRAALVGQRPPQFDEKEPAGSIDSRFAGIVKEVGGLLTAPQGEK